MQNTQPLTTTVKTLQFPPTDVPMQYDGWLAPNGLFYPCGYYGHSSCADEIGETQGIADCSVWKLEQRGYLHISDERVRNADTRPTQAQLNTLWDMYMLDTTSYFAHRIKCYMDKWED